MNFKHSKGFTLIELLVVIAIVSLLSSVVLASVRSAKQKAEKQAFKEHVEQFIYALELYKSEYGNYPGEKIGAETGITYIEEANGTVTDNDNFSFMISPFIKEMPSPNLHTLSDNTSVFHYRTDTDFLWCNGDSKSQYPYTILIHNTQPGFENWEGFRVDPAPNTVQTSLKCFSI